MVSTALGEQSPSARLPAPPNERPPARPTGLAGSCGRASSASRSFSQGNSLCRGYIQKYNDPPVQNWLSVHGTVVGVAGFPHCNPHGLFGLVCDQLAKLCGDLAYTKLTQGLLFQADYFRDPTRANTSEYKSNSQVAQWNNEGASYNATFKANFIAVKQFIMIKALKDSMVYPNEGACMYVRICIHGNGHGHAVYVIYPNGRSMHEYVRVYVVCPNEGAPWIERESFFSTCLSPCGARLTSRAFGAPVASGGGGGGVCDDAYECVFPS